MPLAPSEEVLGLGNGVPDREEARDEALDLRGIELDDRFATGIQLGRQLLSGSGLHHHGLASTARPAYPRPPMPELPEVETIRRQLEPRLTERTIVGAWAHPSAKFAEAPHAVGATIEGVRRRGKYLIVDLDDGHEIVVHLGMTGQLSVVGDRERDPYVRATWDLDDGWLLRYRDVRRFGRIRVVPAGEYSSIATLHAIGPEPFDPEFTGLRLHEALTRSSRRIKTQLLSQRPVAGVGNIYADEALWAARVHPAARTISRPAAQRLRDAIVEALGVGIDNGGTTLRDYRNADGGEGSNQFHLRCYGRAGEPCERCGTELRSSVWDARTTTWCPTCQRR